MQAKIVKMIPDFLLENEHKFQVLRLNNFEATPVIFNSTHAYNN